MTELLRRIVGEHMAGGRGLGRIRKEAVLAFVGLGRSGRLDVAERHDEALDEANRAGAVR